MKAKHVLIDQLITVLKSKLKIRNLSYRDIATALSTSESSVKRWFSQKRIALEDLIAIANLLGISLTELMEESERPSRYRLSITQEEKLMADSELLLVASLVFNNWTLADIIRHYKLTEAQCIKHLLELDRMRLIDLLPENHIRLRVSNDIETHPDGAFRNYFLSRYLRTFLDSDFTKEPEQIWIRQVMLSSSAIAQLKTFIENMKKNTMDLHKQSLNEPMDKRFPITFLLALRAGEDDMSKDWVRK